MLWASDALGRDGKPAVLLLGVTRTSSSLTAELAYVAAPQPEGPLPGRYYRSERSQGEAVTIAWPSGWPDIGAWNKLHPRDTTPNAAVVVLDDVRRVRFTTLEELS